MLDGDLFIRQLHVCHFEVHDPLIGASQLQTSKQISFLATSSYEVHFFAVELRHGVWLDLGAKLIDFGLIPGGVVH